MSQFRKKPVVIEAVRLSEPVVIPTLEGAMTGNPGDWLITGVKGEKYPCKDDIFRATYEAVEEEAAFALKVGGSDYGDVKMPPSEFNTGLKKSKAEIECRIDRLSQSSIPLYTVSERGLFLERNGDVDLVREMPGGPNAISDGSLKVPLLTVDLKVYSPASLTYQEPLLALQGALVQRLRDNAESLRKAWRSRHEDRGILVLLIPHGDFKFERTLSEYYLHWHFGMFIDALDRKLGEARWGSLFHFEVDDTEGEPDTWENSVEMFQHALKQRIGWVTP